MRNTTARWLFAFGTLAWISGVLSANTTYADDLSLPGSFAVGRSEIAITRPDNSTATALLLYPATAAGDDAPFDGTGGSYPVISFGPGFLQYVVQYQPTLEHLASHGYFVVASHYPEANFAPDHATYAEDLLGQFDYLIDANANAASPFFGHVNTKRLGLSGHSMGAGASLLAAATDHRVTAVANLAAAETNPSAIGAMDQIQAPVKLLTGRRDQIVDPATNGQLMYDAGVGPKLLPGIRGGYHCGFQDEAFPIFCDDGPLPAEQQLEITRRELTTYFGLYLQDDDSLWREVWGPEATSDARIVLQSDPGFSVTSPTPQQAGGRGEHLQFELVVANDGPLPNAFDLFVDDTFLPAEFSLLQTPLLDPGETTTLYLDFEIGPDAPLGDDPFLVSIRSQFDGHTRAFTRLTATVVPEPSTLLLAACGFALVPWISRRKPAKSCRRGDRV